MIVVLDVQGPDSNRPRIMRIDMHDIFINEIHRLLTRWLSKQNESSARYHRVASLSLGGERLTIPLCEQHPQFIQEFQSVVAVAEQEECQRGAACFNNFYHPVISLGRGSRLLSAGEFFLLLLLRHFSNPGFLAVTGKAVSTRTGSGPIDR